MPLSFPPPRRSRSGGPLALLKVHWVRPELVVEIPLYLGCTDEPLLHPNRPRRSRRVLQSSHSRRYKHTQKLVSQHPHARGIALEIFLDYLCVFNSRTAPIML